MSRVKLTVALTGATLVAGTAGYVMGVLFAPASGAETRRRLVRRAEDEWTHLSHSCTAAINRASGPAKEALRAAAEGFRDTVSH
jgi:gas vesicle protein